MNLEQLERFLVIAQYENMTKAAETLNVSQASLSYSLSSLESELGVELFTRDKKKLNLTVKGSELLPYANKIGELVNLINEKIAEPDDVIINIAPTGSFGSFLIDILPMELKQNLNFIIKYEDDMPEALYKGEIMAAITEQFTFKSINSNIVSSYLLGAEQIGVFVNPGNPLLKNDSLKWSDLDNIALVKNINTIAVNSWISRIEKMRNKAFPFKYIVDRHNIIEDCDAVEIATYNGIYKDPTLSHHLSDDAIFIPIKDNYSNRYVYIWYLTKNKKYLNGIFNYLNSLLNPVFETKK